MADTGTDLERRGSGDTVKREGGGDGGKDEGSRVPWALWVLVAAMLVTVGLLYKARVDLRDTTVALQAAQAGNRKKQEQMTGLLTELVKSKASKLRVAEMAGATVYEMGAGKQSPSAKLFWNKGDGGEGGDGVWVLIASGLRVLPAGREYELWMVNDKGEKTGVGTFGADGAGRAVVEVRLPGHGGRILGAEVTEESRGGVKQPTGVVEFGGKL